MLDSEPYLIETDFPSIRRGKLEALQVNLGYLCNLSCTHCHVNAGPKRTELMSKETIDQLLMFMADNDVRQLDVTGGAPEMNPHFRYLVKEARAMDVGVIDRCNLTVLFEPGYEDLAEFLAEQQVMITASLPCYQEDNVAQQRGKGVYQLSIEALQRLNSLGYGRQLPLDLVYNPGGPFLPPPQEGLEADYKRELGDQYDIVFNRLLTITNMPISRFGGSLLAKNQFDEYMSLLKENFSQDNLHGVMCRSLISVDWQGYIYDCDFNQMLDWPIQFGGDAIARDRLHISSLIGSELDKAPIVVGEHCYGCTAGQGSSCSGALNG